MIKVSLVNMPFAEWNRPSFALSQLAALGRRELGDEVAVDVHYLNFDFARYFGVTTYDAVAGNLEHLLTGLGEWLFRDIAFPHQQDNTETYFRRYYQGQRWRDFRAHITDRRDGLADLCERLIDAHDLASADVVGFTSMFAQNAASIAMARLIRRRNPQVRVILGGANCEVPMGGVIAEQVDAIDAVFSGPALHTFVDYLRCLQAGDLAGTHRIPGVLTARNRHDPRLARAIGKDREIDDYFEPDYESFITAFSANRDSLNGATRPVLLFETSRGCWWGERAHCTFCGLNGLGMNYRAMSPQLARRQFEWLFGFAPWCDEFSCTDNILPRNYTKDVFAELTAPPGVSLFYEVKLPLSEYDMRMLAKAGVTKIQPGIEALATETLKLMDKGTSVFQNLQFLKNSVAHGLDPKWNLLMGFPGERAEVYQKYVQDIPLLAHLPPPAGAYMVRFDRYSPYYAKAEQYGLELRPMDFYSLVYPFNAEQLARLAYFFADQNFAPYLAGAIEWLGPVNEQIDRWREAWSADGTRPELSLSREGSDQLWIRDTRSGEERRYPVDDAAHQLLRRLTSPVREKRLRDELGTEVDVAGSLAFLRAHNLLFEEGDRLMSLVLLDEPDNAEEPAVATGDAADAAEAPPGKRLLPLSS